MRKIGLDFGTSNLKAAELRPKGVVQISLGTRMDEKTIPNIISYEKKKDSEQVQFYIGKTAVARSVPENDRIANIKSHLIEENWTHSFSFGEKYTAYEIVRDSLKTLFEGIQKNNRAEEISATITVPVNFSKRQQAMIEKAAEEAGFHVEHVITEPFAAACKLMNDSIDDEKKHDILVFDFGGGTLDLCLVEIEPDDDVTRINTQATRGISLGGNTVNEDILEEIFRMRKPDEINAALGDNVGESRKYINRFRIMEEIDNIKTELFCDNDVEEDEEADCTVTLDLPEAKLVDMGTISVKDIHEVLKKKKYKERIQRTLDCLFDDSDLFPEDVTDVFMVGGSSSIPYFRKVLEEYFEDNGHDDSEALFELNDDMDMEERASSTVAMGAVTYSHLLEDDDYEIKDRIPFRVYTKSFAGKEQSVIMMNDCFKGFSSPVAFLSEDVKKTGKIEVYQRIFGETDKEVYIGVIELNDEIARNATLYRLAIDAKRNIRAEFGYSDKQSSREGNLIFKWNKKLEIAI